MSDWKEFILEHITTKEVLSTCHECKRKCKKVKLFVDLEFLALWTIVWFILIAVTNLIIGGLK